jgi:hypothetical protein
MVLLHDHEDHHPHIEDLQETKSWSVSAKIIGDGKCGNMFRRIIDLLIRR